MMAAFQIIIAQGADALGRAAPPIGIERLSRDVIDTGHVLDPLHRTGADESARTWVSG